MCGESHHNVLREFQPLDYRRESKRGLLLAKHIETLESPVASFQLVFHPEINKNKIKQEKIQLKN